MNKRVVHAQQLLYLTYGILPIITGCDKFFNYIVDWTRYLNPMIPEFFHMSPVFVNKVVGVIEIVAGLLVLWSPVVGGYIVGLWLAAIAVNLVTMGAHMVEGCQRSFTYYDIAVRDLAMAVGAFVLALLSKEKEEQSQHRR